MSKQSKPDLSIKCDTGMELTEEQKALVYDETDRYSVTPTSFKHREFINTFQSPFFVDTFGYKSESVMRFGLNLLSDELVAQVLEYNQKEDKPIFDTKSMVSAISKNDKSKISEDIVKTRDFAKQILTYLEQNNSNAAINYLKNGDDIVVLVDIFEREANNNIVIDRGLPVTHTIVLHKKFIIGSGPGSIMTEKYLVIDPSNATFSTILAGANDNIRVCFSNKVVIYKANEGDIGPGNNQYRDCIDCAFKLALHIKFNSQFSFDNFNVIEVVGTNTGYIEFESIKKAPSVREITNQKAMYSLHSKVYELPIRLKQSSDVIESKKITACLHSLEIIIPRLKAFRDKLTDQNKLFASKSLDTQEQNITNQLFPEDFKIPTQIITFFENTLSGPFYQEIKSDVELLALELYHLDSQILT